MILDAYSLFKLLFFVKMTIYDFRKDILYVKYQFSIGGWG